MSSIPLTLMLKSGTDGHFMAFGRTPPIGPPRAYFKAAISLAIVLQCCQPRASENMQITRPWKEGTCMVSH